MPYNIAGTNVTADFVMKMVNEGAILVDVRTQCEFAGYHIEGSVNVPYDKIERMVDMIERMGKPVITYSAHGRRSEIAAQKLRSLGIAAFDAGSIHKIEKAMNGSSEYEGFDSYF